MGSAWPLSSHDRSAQRQLNHSLPLCLQFRRMDVLLALFEVPTYASGNHVLTRESPALLRLRHLDRAIGMLLGDLRRIGPPLYVLDARDSLTKCCGGANLRRTRAEAPNSLTSSAHLFVLPEQGVDDAPRIVHLNYFVNPRRHDVVLGV